MTTVVVPRPSVYAAATNHVAESDPVNHPAHYTYGKIECIDYIEDKQFDFCLGNAIKYITRAGHKENAVEDLQKAIFYLNRKIKQLERSTT